MRPRPAFTVDIVILTDHNPKAVLLIQRARPPFKDRWALPGGYVEDGETAANAAVRELHEETGVSSAELAFLGLYDAPGRDPRGWTISAAFMSELSEEIEVLGGDDAQQARWFPIQQLPPLAFDHASILSDALTREPTS